MLVSCGDAVSSQGDLGDVTQRPFSFPCRRDSMVEYMSALHSPLPVDHLVKWSALLFCVFVIPCLLVFCWL